MPSRKENSYRDYSEDDANEILKIKLLRQLDLPIETIKQLQQGNVNITDVLRKQAITLGNKLQLTQRAAEICKEISGKVMTYQNLDAVHYLDKLSKDPDTAEVVTKAGVCDSVVEYHPVRRFVARMADYTLLRLIVRFVIIVILRVRPLSDFWSNVINYGCLLLSIPVQACLLHCFATTPGKWLMGIKVLSYKGHKLDITNALQREWDALLINVVGTAQNKTTYDFYLEGERLSRITYSNTWTDFTYWSLPDGLINTCITAVMSQRGMRTGDLKKFVEMMDEQLAMGSGNITYENVTIQWTIDAMGCTKSGSKYYATESGQTPTVTLQFELIIN